MKLDTNFSRHLWIEPCAVLNSLSESRISGRFGKRIAITSTPPPLIKQLIDRGRYYFLSRPRRFGKSLLVDTLQELFTGSEELFRGLDIHERWDWSESHPVVRLSFDGKYNEPGEVERSVLNHPRRTGIGSRRFSRSQSRGWAGVLSPECYQVFSC